MKKDIAEGPRSLRLWVEDGGKIAGLEWHCPEDGCWEYQGGERREECPHRNHENGLCNDTIRARNAMVHWAESAFFNFAKLFRERA